MGVYNDYSYTGREKWTFRYKAKDLLESAKQKLIVASEREQAARKNIATLMLDVAVAASDDRINELKREIEAQASLKEKCEIWVHEFERMPEATYDLLLGDVSFFDLHVQK